MIMTTAETTAPTLDAIINALTFDKRLWDMSDIATYLNRSYNTVMNVITKMPDFPKAIRLTSDKDNPLYDPKDVNKWVDSKKQKR